MAKRFHVNPEIEELLDKAKVEFPYSKVRNYRTVRNRLVRLSKDCYSDDLTTIVKQMIEEYKGCSTVAELVEKIRVAYDLDETQCEEIKQEAERIILGKH